LSESKGRLKRSKGTPVITADHLGKTKLEKALFEDRKGFLNTGRKKSFTGKEIPTRVISNREWITVFPILGLKLTFKVDTPDLIGFVAGSKLMG